MSVKQEDYFIGVEENQLYKVISTLKCIKDRANGCYKESVERLLKEIEDGDGQSLSPWAMDFLITLLLDYVPEEEKKRYF